MGKPSIEQLEKILDGKCPPISIEPNGELKMDYKNCPFLEECRNSPKSSKVANDSVSTNKQLLCPKCHSKFIWASVNGAARKCDECKHNWSV